MVQNEATSEEENSRELTVAAMLESILGCKWSLAVLGALAAEVTRPSELQRACQGISTKVLNERLRKLERFGIVSRTVFAEAPPRVEYRLTSFGDRFRRLIDEVERLERELDTGSDLKQA